MKKVLFVIDSLDCGGAEKSLVSLLPLLDYSALDVDLMLVKRGGIFEHFLPPQVHVVPFPKASPWIFQFYQGLFSLRRKMLRLAGIRQHGAETRWQIMSYAYPIPDKYYDAAVAYQQGFPTYYVAEKVHARKKWAWINVDLEKAGYRPRFNRPFYARIAGVCTVSDALSGLISDSGFVSPDKIRVVKDILNVDVIRSLSNVTLDTFKTPGMIKILTVGRMAPPKNYPLAIETARVLREKGLAFIWIFVGEGGERENVETLILQRGLQNHITLAGLQPNPYPYYKACDIYVQTSSYEGFGLTLSEAKILHKPVVTTNFPSAFDQIQNGKNGLIAEMTPESLAEKILMLVNDSALREAIIQETEKEQNRTAETECVKINAMLKD